MVCQFRVAPLRALRVLCLGRVIDGHATGNWTTALWVYAGTVVPMAIGGLMMVPPDRYFEDKFA
jgi:hypothetical protein